MKKAKKGLLLSLLTLLMAVAVTATSTYAWFVVNRSVTASNMQITVKSDTTYLVISASNSTVTSGALDSTSESLTLTAATPHDVLPVRYNASATPASGMTKWEFATGSGYDNGTAKANSTQAVASANLANYVVDYTFYVGLTETTAAAASNLKIKDLIVENVETTDPDNTFMNAVSVVVECGAVAINCTNDNGLNSLTEQQCNALGTLVSDVALNTVYAVTCHVYINGDNAVVKSSNATHIASFKLSIELAID